MEDLDWEYERRLKLVCRGGGREDSKSKEAIKLREQADRIHLAFSSHPIVDVSAEQAQAFVPKTAIRSSQCVRCRATFGYSCSELEILS